MLYFGGGISRLTCFRQKDRQTSRFMYIDMTLSGIVYHIYDIYHMIITMITVVLKIKSLQEKIWSYSLV